MRKPNIIMIMTDQQRYDTIGALGYPYMSTPNLDKLANEGTVFERCYSTAASCVPARASLFNGCYPHTSGVFCNEDAWRRTWVEQLSAAGYYCASIGKMHAIPVDELRGFHERFIVENKDRPRAKRGDRLLTDFAYVDEWDKAIRVCGYQKPGMSYYGRNEDFRQRLGAFDWPLPERLHADFFVGDAAQWWISNYIEEKPFFLQIGFPGPHPPYDPPPRYSAPYLEKEFPLPTYDHSELDRQPVQLRSLQESQRLSVCDSIVFDPDASKEALKRQRAHYFGNVTMIDEEVGRILDELDSRGYLQDAVVIFTSDHGNCMGDHGQSQKWCMYEEVVRVPLIFWSKNKDLVKPGRIATLCQLMDIGPTVLEFAGAESATPLEAESLKPALLGNEYRARDRVFAEDLGLGENRTHMTMIRDARYKLVHFRGYETGQLFDLQEDPAETRNLYGDPGHAGLRSVMYDSMREWLMESNYRTLGLRSALS